MSRNEEKAASMLHRWLAFQRNESNWGIKRTAGMSGFEEQEARKQEAREAERRADKSRGGRFDRRRIGRRPFHTSEVTDHRIAEKWRMQVVREIGTSIVDIQDESLPEDALRELNDRINRLQAEQSRWEHRIVELGGKDHRPATSSARTGNGALHGELAGAEYVVAPHADGKTTRYFGAARNLPEVRAVHERSLQDKAKAQRRLGAPQTVTGGDYTAAELRAAQVAAREPLDAEYFALGVDFKELEAAERLVGGEVLRAVLATQWGGAGDADDETYERAASATRIDDLACGPEFQVPSLALVEQRLVEQRQRELLQRFGGVQA